MKNYPHRKSPRKPIGNNKVQLLLLKAVCQTSKPATSWTDSEGDARSTCWSLRTARQTVQWLWVNKAAPPVLLPISTFSRYLYLPKSLYPAGQRLDIHLAYFFFSMIPLIGFKWILTSYWAQISEFFQIINIPSFPWFTNPPIFLSSRITETKVMVSRGDEGEGWVKRGVDTVMNIVISLCGDRWSLDLVWWSHCKV